jgi:hypothetical protein
MATANTKPAAEKPLQPSVMVAPGPDSQATTATENVPTFESWVHQQYLAHGFEADGVFKGYKWLKEHLASLRPQTMEERSRIVQVVNR